MTTPGQHPATCARREFAAILGCKPGYVTQLIAQGRVVLTDDGKQVRVAESLARIRATRDPAHQPVADRHAASRGQALASQPEDDGDDDHPQPDGEEPTGPLYDFQGSKAKDAFYVAEMRKVEYLKLTRDLVPRGDVVASYADAGAAIRAAVDAWAADLPPMLAGQGEDAIRATLTDEAERLLADLAARFNQLASAEVDE